MPETLSYGRAPRCGSRDGIVSCILGCLPLTAYTVCRVFKEDLTLGPGETRSIMGAILVGILCIFLVMAVVSPLFGVYCGVRGLFARGNGKEAALLGLLMNMSYILFFLLMRLG